MPKRKPTAKRGGASFDLIHFPLVYSFNAGSGGVTTVQTVTEAFDRRRPFRISAATFELSAYKYPVLCQVDMFSPVSSADNAWSAPSFLVPTGTTVRRVYRGMQLPFYPAETALTTTLMQVFGICIDKNTVGHVLGKCELVLELGARELDYACSVMCTVPYRVKDGRPLASGGDAAGTAASAPASPFELLVGVAEEQE